MFSPRLSIKPQINNNNNKKNLQKKVHQLKANQPATQEKKNLRK